MIDLPFRTNQIEAQKLLEQCYFRCLKTANELQDTRGICIPPLGANFWGFDTWTISQCTAKAARHFIDETSPTTRKMKHVEFINLTLSMADIMSIVFREVCKTGKTDNTETVCKRTVETTEASKATTPLTTVETTVILFGKIHREPERGMN